jgi:hypothetical protein
VIELNGYGEVVRTNKSSENGIPSNVGFMVELSEGEKSIIEGTQVDIDIDEV